MNTFQREPKPSSHGVRNDSRKTRPMTTDLRRNLLPVDRSRTRQLDNTEITSKHLHHEFFPNVPQTTSAQHPQHPDHPRRPSMHAQHLEMQLQDSAQHWSELAREPSFHTHRAHHRSFTVCAANIHFQNLDQKQPTEHRFTLLDGLQTANHCSHHWSARASYARTAPSTAT
jgi:hypothetical protein